MKNLQHILFLFFYLPLIGQHRIEEGYKQVNGVELYFRALGKGEPIIVLPGGPGLDASYLHPSLDPLSANFRLISYDPRSAGKSKGVMDTLRLTADQFVEDLEGLRQSFGINKMHLMGHSYGGLLAMLYASKYPQHLYSLTLISSGAADTSMARTQAKTADERLSLQDKEAVAKMTAAGYFNTDTGRIKLFNILWKPYVFDQQNVKLIKNAVGDNTFGIMKHVPKSTQGYILYDKLYQHLLSLSIPTLIIHGDYDPVPLAAAEKNYKSIKGSELVVLKDCGHFPFIEQQQKFMKIVLGFLQSLKKQ
jgi:proline iminopeptidase